MHCRLREAHVVVEDVLDAGLRLEVGDESSELLPFRVGVGLILPPGVYMLYL